MLSLGGGRGTWHFESLGSSICSLGGGGVPLNRVLEHGFCVGPVTLNSNYLRGVWDLGCIEGCGFCFGGSDFQRFPNFGLAAFWGSRALVWFRVIGSACRTSQE